MSSGASVLLNPTALASALGIAEVHDKWVKTRKGATLWAGYGSISEVTVTDPKSKDASHRLILKRVSPPENGSGESHDRKVRSYDVEAAFYADDGPAVVLSRAGVNVPTPLAVGIGMHSMYVFYTIRGYSSSSSLIGVKRLTSQQSYIYACARE